MYGAVASSGPWGPPETHGPADGGDPSRARRPAPHRRQAEIGKLFPAHSLVGYDGRMVS